MQDTDKYINSEYSRFLRVMPFKEKLYYGVMLAMFRDGEANTLKYEVTIRWIGKEKNLHIYEIDRLTKIFINEEEPDLIADQLALQTASVLYPLQLNISWHEGIIGVHNLKDIQERWRDTKKKIMDYNEGEIVEKYLRLTENTLHSESALLHSLRNDWFLFAYFEPIYQFYDNENKLHRKIQAPFIFNADGVKYDIEQSIEPKTDKRGYVNINIEGKCSDTRSPEELEGGFNHSLYESEFSTTGKYKAIYMLNEKDHTIESLGIDAELQLTQKRTISLVISRINK